MRRPPTGPFAIALLITVGIPGVGAGSPTAPILPSVGIPGTLEIGPFLSHPYSGFWAVGIPGDYKLGPSLAADFNATPFVLIRYGAEIDATNLSAGCTYSDGGVCGHLNESIPTFRTFCGWVDCLSILAVPGEPNDPGLAADTVRYVEQTLGFDPTFWSIGNEPEAWEHFGIPQSAWRPTDHRTPTGTQYGAMVANVSRAIRSVDPDARVIGDQDAQSGSVDAYLRNVSLQSNATVAGVAFHAYPGGSGPPHPTLPEFLSPANVGRVAGFLGADRRAYDWACGCSKSVFVGEFNGALGGGSFAPFLAGYADVPMVAAAAVQMLTAGAAAFSVFAYSGSQPYDLVSSVNGSTSPTYQFLSGIASYLPMGSVYSASVNTSIPGVYAVESRDNDSRAGVLVVNSNTTEALALSLGGWFGSAGGREISDAPVVGILSTDFPAGSTPSTVIVPPEGIALLLTGPSGPPTKGNGDLPTNGTGAGPPPTNPHPSRSDGNPFLGLGGLSGAPPWIVPVLAVSAAALAVVTYLLVGRPKRGSRPGS